MFVLAGNLNFQGEKDTEFYQYISQYITKMKYMLCGFSLTALEIRVPTTGFKMRNTQTYNYQTTFSI